MKIDRAWLFLLIGVLILVAVDRIYAFNLPSGFSYEYTHNDERGDQQKQRTRSFLVVLFVEFEELIEAHEKLLIVLSTLAIAGFTGTLWRSTSALEAAAKKQGDDTKNAIDIAKEQLAVSKELAKISSQQVAIQALQTDIQEKQHAVGRLQFLATHRPKLILRDAFCEGNEVDDQICVTYVIVNVGESPARIVESKMEVRLITTEGSGFGPHPRISLNEGENEIGDLSIEPGEGKILTHNSGRKWQASARHEFANQEFGVFFCGDIAYEDSRDIKRHAMFFRKYDLGQCRFFQINTPTMRALDNSD